MDIYTNTVGDFTPGGRVAIHPATDWWMRGWRYMWVEHVGTDWVYLISDPQAFRPVRFRVHPTDIAPVSS